MNLYLNLSTHSTLQLSYETNKITDSVLRLPNDDLFNDSITVVLPTTLTNISFIGDKKITNSLPFLE